MTARRLIALGAFLVLFAIASNEDAGALTLRPGSATDRPYADWIAEAEAQVPVADVRVWVHAEACPWVDAAACANGRTVWLCPGCQRPIFFHEIGHLFDYWEMTRADRDAYRQVTGATGRWRPAEAWSRGYAWVGERFADSYRDCALGAGEPAVCDLIDAAASR